VPVSTLVQGELEEEPTEQDERPDPPGPVAFERQAPLEPAVIESSYEGPTVLPGNVVLEDAQPSGGGSPDPAESAALGRARAEFQRIAQLARQDHDELQHFLREMAQEVMARHKALEERAATFIGETGPAIDRVADEAKDGVTKTETRALKDIDQASLQARRLVWGTAAMAKKRIAANAEAAKTDVVTIVNDLAKKYTDVLENASSAISRKGTDVQNAITRFVADLPVKYPFVPDQPHVDVENEARRSQAQVVSMSGDPNHKGSPPSCAICALDTSWNRRFGNCCFSAGGRLLPRNWASELPTE
jgi:hypothetical protein